MRPSRRLTSSAVIVVITAILLPGPVSAAEASEVEDLRREVRQLQSQLQMLRTAVIEATEFERQRSTILAGRLKDPPKASEPEPDAPMPVTEAPATSRETKPATVAAAADDRPVRAKNRRHRHRARSRSKSGR
jgi:hypothetical protein